MHKRILVIHTDEQHHQCLGKFSDVLKTPQMGRLAERGTHFTRAYAAAGVCVPSRASLMTGRYPIGHGVMCNQVSLPRDESTLGSCFGAADFATGYFGKTHYGRDDQDPRQDGWTSFFGKKDYNRYLQRVGVDATWPEGTAIDRYDMRYWTMGRSRIPSEHYFEPVVTDQATEFMEANRDNPFLCFVSMVAPHGPFTPPVDYAAIYDPQRMPLAPRYEGEVDGKSPQAQRWIKQNQLYLNDDELRIWTATVFGLLHMVDDCIARLLGTLEMLGIRDETLVIFASDHGDFATRYGIIGKSWVQTDDLMRIPLIIDCPGARTFGEHEALVQNIDLLPTMLDYAGLPIPPKTHGRSLLPLLRGEAEGLDRPAFAYDRFEYSQDCCDTSMIVDWPWKYVHQAQGWRELYHLEDDPCECHNLAERPEHKAVVADLREKLLDWHVGGTGRPFNPDTATFWEDETLFYDATRFNGERQVQRVLKRATSGTSETAGADRSPRVGPGEATSSRSG